MNSSNYGTLFIWSLNGSRFVIYELPDAMAFYAVAHMIMPTDLRCPMIFVVAIKAFPSGNIFFRNIAGKNANLNLIW